MRAAQLAIVSSCLTACGRLAFDDEPRGDGDAGDASATDDGKAAACAAFTRPPASKFVDDFATGSFAPNWYNAGTCMQIRAGEIFAPLPVNASNEYCLAFSSETYRLACSEIFIHVAEAATQTFGAQTAIYLATPVGEARLILDNGGFVLSSPQTTDFNVLSPPYDAVADAWWRVRADPSSIHLDTGPDGMSWSPRGSLLSLPFVFDDVRVILGTGTYSAISNGGTARFRCLNTPPPCN